MKNKILLIFVLFTSLISPSAHAVSPHRRAAANRAVQKIFDDMDMASLSIAVTQGDSIIYQQAFGYRILPDAQHKGEILETDDMYRIASVSKTFIATAIMRLTEEGILDINEDAQRYLTFPLRNPQFPDSVITIKNLLTHTSGINDSRSWWKIDFINPRIDKDYYKCYSDYAPGHGYKYCNMNYALLGAVIEGATGTRFDRVVSDKIMKPLNLGGGYNVNYLDRSKLAQLYYRPKENPDTLINDTEYYRQYRDQLIDNYTLGRSLGLEYPSSGMKITASDLARYMMMHMYNGELDSVRIISPESEAMIRRNYVGSNNYGLAFREYRNFLPGRLMHGQTGGSQGATTCMIFDPEEEIGFVILESGAKTDFIDGYGDVHVPIARALYNALFAE